ncbi:glycosyltransferase family 4 protein [Phosphitispora fastidiosa]|uniref:glycosyltransferase family 4 protein n=1 Tax=Phosphitispora fastidiosa TaxID=2837202 RepID=UPI001E35ADDA|nr:MraY family glycosyltransferase [Phosphitispora fastidiosa]MBU7008219.1 UDP-GlcNAc:undecaprenyl-phosphate GlcNAc-1-phosphate transferase [Phosphitispora fastidiosa]
MAGLYQGFIIAFLISLAVTPVIRKLAFRLGAVDRPDARKVHSRLMPRMGGLAVYLAFTVTVLIMGDLTDSMKGLLIGGTLIMLLGLVDDIKDISPRVKLLGQIIAAAVLVAFGIQVDFITNPWGGTFSLTHFGINFGIPLTILWIVGITNAVNLIDGLDGLAGGLASIAALTLAVVGWVNGQMWIVLPAVILSAAVIGFLKYNFYPAKIFLGDSGSLFLGFMLAGMSVIGLTKQAAMFSVFVPVLIFGIPIFDTLFAILRRYINNQPIFSADKEHLHHRLLAIGLSHRQTVLAIYLVSCLLGGSAVMMTFMTSEQAFAAFIGITLLVLIGANRVGVLRTRAGRRAQRQYIETENKSNYGA